MHIFRKKKLEIIFKYQTLICISIINICMHDKIRRTNKANNNSIVKSIFSFIDGLVYLMLPC